MYEQMEIPPNESNADDPRFLKEHSSLVPQTMKLRKLTAAAGNQDQLDAMSSDSSVSGPFSSTYTVRRSAHISLGVTSAMEKDLSDVERNRLQG